MSYSMSVVVCVCVSMERYSSLSREEVLGNIPMMFITFPSAKDPTSTIRHPGNTFPYVNVYLFFRCVSNLIQPSSQVTSFPPLTMFSSSRDFMIDIQSWTKTLNYWVAYNELQSLVPICVPLKESPEWRYWPWLAMSGSRNGRGQSLEREDRTTWIWKTAWLKSCWNGHLQSSLIWEIRCELSICYWTHVCLWIYTCTCNIVFLWFLL